MQWRERIERAKAYWHFFEDDLELAVEWVTCACGEQDSRIPRGSSGCPEDGELRFWGIAFAWNVRQGNFSRALDVLNKIEARSQQLLLEMGASPGVSPPDRLLEESGI